MALSAPGEHGEERLVCDDSTQPPSIVRCTYNIATRQWERGGQASLCWRLWLRGKAIASPPPQEAYYEDGRIYRLDGVDTTPKPEKAAPIDAVAESVFFGLPTDEGGTPLLQSFAPLEQVGPTL